MEKTVGKSRNAGYQFGLRKTFSISLDFAWNFLISRPAVRIWLGDISEIEFKEQFEYQTADGCTGKIRVVKPFSHMRMTWKKPDWSNHSILQLRTIKVPEEKTTISIHQEHLQSAVQRQEMKIHWSEVMTAIEKQMQIHR